MRNGDLHLCVADVHRSNLLIDTCDFEVLLDLVGAYIGGFAVVAKSLYLLPEQTPEDERPRNAGTNTITFLMVSPLLRRINPMMR